MIFDLIHLNTVCGATKKCVQVASPEPQCGPNEVFSTCGPVNDCEATCKPFSSDIACPYICLTKCVCRDGYVRDNSEDRNCVPVESCSSHCEENEIYSECGSGCGDASCQNYDAEPGFCPTYCNVGCFCDKGYVRGPNKKCITVAECTDPTDRCGENQDYVYCGSACGNLTCDNRNEAARTCLAVCLEGCFCKEGFVEGPDGNCIIAEQCPPSCIFNEVWTDCGRPEPCVATCNNLNPFDNCADECIERCECADGYVWDNVNDKNCVPVSSCSGNSCGANEVWTDCGRPEPCVATCNNLNPFDNCADVCIERCECADGYVWDNVNDKNCIAVTSCAQ
ncbi:CLUMA_CG016479, isoform A [Clunio marinus]|uniref:CLUMA_CG016479, isoform A n=1 Tax=Clunio marinus TaxID=568069 RepID=A0A1J1IV23_9DIPT|nr:CLUMA_CG016479, isoform A [Clunio marinus]